MEPMGVLGYLWVFFFLMARLFFTNESKNNLGPIFSTSLSYPSYLFLKVRVFDSLLFDISSVHFSLCHLMLWTHSIL